MPSSTRLGPAELSELMLAASKVMADHATGLDELDRDPDTADAPHTGSVPWNGPEPVGSTAQNSGGGGVGSEIAASLAAAAGRLGGATGAGAVVDALEASRTADGHEGIDTVLRSLGAAMRNADAMDAERLSIGLELAADALVPRDAPASPGRLPAVVGATAAAALESLDAGGSLLDVLVAAAEGGLEELERGPQLDPELVERGAIDPAAAGYLLLLDSIAAWVAGEPLPAPPDAPDELASAAGSSVLYAVACSVEPHESEHLEDANWLESTWHELGEVVRFDRHGERWEVELHTSLPGTAVEAICDVGRPRELRIAVTRGGSGAIVDAP